MYPVDYTTISEETYTAYAVHWSAALMFSASLQKHVKQQDPEMKDVEQAISSWTYSRIYLSEGMQNGRLSDAYCLKTNTAMLVNKTMDNLTLNRDSKSDRGFNHDTFGRLLIPIQHFVEYDSDPLRTKVNGGVKGYKVTAHDTPAFLYEDPSKYNPDDILFGFMQGYFLARLVNTSIVAYVAIQQAWSSKDEDFDYEEFANNIFKVFKENEEWPKQGPKPRSAALMRQRPRWQQLMRQQLGQQLMRQQLRWQQLKGWQLRWQQLMKRQLKGQQPRWQQLKGQRPRGQLLGNDRATMPGSPLTPSKSEGNIRANTPPHRHHNNNMEAPRLSQKCGNENNSQDKEQDLRVSNKKRSSQKKRGRCQY
ncbi:hypothetical protein EDB92DRAFT_1819043 [Lactarius akahatsu]|uniref:Uncharacterized protein n=1 Tax=Lactarius akahatsu TaxID=416441 RepID=A0AAD4LCM9_9AGAM|nr:hypothetical protein EDB92DRAFT_1819043 [Lactarius akahatsu]